MDNLYDIVVDPETRVEVLARIMEETVSFVQWPNMSVPQDRSDDPPEQTHEPEFYFMSTDASNKYAYSKYGNNYHRLQKKERRISWPETKTDFASYATISERSMQCGRNGSEIAATEGLFVWHNDYDIGYNEHLIKKIISNPQTPCEPFPSKGDVRTLMRNPRVIVQTSAGFWVVSRYSETDIDLESYEPIYKTLSQMLETKIKTNKLQDASERIKLQRYLQVANMLMYDSNIKIQYFNTPQHSRPIPV